MVNHSLSSPTNTHNHQSDLTNLQQMIAYLEILPLSTLPYISTFLNMHFIFRGSHGDLLTNPSCLRLHFRICRSSNGFCHRRFTIFWSIFRSSIKLLSQFCGLDVMVPNYCSFSSAIVYLEESYPWCTVCTRPRHEHPPSPPKA